jgi:hypothetical protein
MGRERVLRCYAVSREARSWEAICLDLDIAVQGDSFADVSRKLGEAIRSYVEYVVTLPEEDRERLMHRRAPWHIRFKFVSGTILTMLFHRPDGGGRQSFGLPCTV